MGSSRYWRIVGVSSLGNDRLELSELRLFDSGVLADMSATLTSSLPPDSGSVDALTDNLSTTTVSWVHAKYSAPGFEFVWDFGDGGGIEFAQLQVGSGAHESTFVQDVMLQSSTDRLNWVTYSAPAGVMWPGSFEMTNMPSTVTSHPIEALDYVFPNAQGFSDAAYANGRWIATIGGWMNCYVSTDGESWRAVPIAYGPWQKVTKGPGDVWLLTGDSNVVLRSADNGETWVDVTPPGSSGTYFAKAAAYGNGTFLLIPKAPNGVYFTSTDAITWTSHAGNFHSYWGYGCNRVDFVNGRFIVNATDSPPRVSVDGVTWTSWAYYAGAGGRICFGNGVYVSCGRSSNDVYTSVDGSSWVRGYLHSSFSTAYGYEGFVFGAGLFVAASTAVSPQVIAVSTDGIKWKHFANVAYRGSNNFATGDGYFLLSSDKFKFVYPMYESFRLASPAVKRAKAQLPIALTCQPDAPMLETTAKQHPREFSFFDWADGGAGVISGTVKNTPSTPVVRRVQIMNERSRQVVKAVWSNSDGVYEFRGLNEKATYTVLSYDHTGTYRAVVSDRVIPEVSGGCLHDSGHFS